MITLGGCEESTCTVEANSWAEILCRSVLGENATLRICLLLEPAFTVFASNVPASSIASSARLTMARRWGIAMRIILTPSVIPVTGHRVNLAVYFMYRPLGQLTRL